MFEKLFESGLWNSRLFTLFAVVFSLIGAIILFVVASLDIWGVLVLVWDVVAHHAHPEHLHEDVVSSIIGAIDLYLIAIVLLIFSLGVYELFVSKIDAAEDEDGKSSSVLQIHSLDQLKDKIAKVIVMVLVVNFFQRVLHTQFNGALEMLYFSGSILLLALALYFLHKGDQQH
ncbi:YqhA family protein [Sulfurimonas sp. HSL-3221]|uniref:YqhA family protein n=1 Tax=Sulfurimonadaceae TaxID=2771471 RepID=UPI001E33EE76|nr:YqhA family protein [Sulfurimonas sp. HSL-3221]UFS62196.1 YqhA family protein [Sulfurimonas sp. HSL-3221]